MPIQCSRPKNLRIGFTFLLLSLIMRAYLLPRPFCAVPAEAPAFAGIPPCIFPLHLPRRGVAHTVCAAALPELSARAGSARLGALLPSNGVVIHSEYTAIP